MQIPSILLIDETCKLQRMRLCVEGMGILSSLCLECFKYDTWLKFVFKYWPPNSVKIAVFCKAGNQPQSTLILILALWEDSTHSF